MLGQKTITCVIILLFYKKKGRKMKHIYIIETYECGRWSGYYAAGYFTSEKQANLFLIKMLAGLDPCKKDLYKIQRIYKNNY